MTVTGKVTIVRHNLLGSESHEAEGIVVNEIYYNEHGIETERFNYDAAGEPEEHITYRIIDGNVVEERLELNGEFSESVTREYSSEGKIVKEIRTYQGGDKDVTHYKYENDKLVEKVVIDEDGEEGEKLTWEFVGGKLTKEMHFGVFGDVQSEKEYYYNENGVLNEVIEIVAGDENPEKVITQFNDKGLLVLEKKYDPKDRLIARTKIEYNENSKPVVYEEETVRGKKITTLQYDDAGNNILQIETDQDGSQTSYVERTFDENNRQLSAEIIIEPRPYQYGQHYRLEYIYEKEKVI